VDERLAPERVVDIHADRVIAGALDVPEQRDDVLRLEREMVRSFAAPLQEALEEVVLLDVERLQ
jgi:hypothetical protein